MAGLGLLVVAIIVITAIVGAIAQFLNKLNEANAAPAKAAGRREGGTAAQKDMDRFLAEIDRLRKKNQQTADTTAARPEPPPKAKPKNKSKVDRLKPARPVAEVVDPPKRKRIELAPMDVRPLPTAAPADLSSLPTAPVVGAIPTTGIEGATKVTKAAKLPALPGSKAQSKLDGNLATLLASGHGMVLGVVLQEVLGPPKCKRTESK